MNPVTIAIVDIVVISKEWVAIVPPRLAKLAQAVPCLHAVGVLTVGAKVTIDLAGAVEVAFTLLNHLTAMSALMGLAADNLIAAEKFHAHYATSSSAVVR